MSILTSALAVGFELALSGTAPAGLVLPAMGLVHLVVGVIEGTLTASAMRLVASVRVVPGAAPREPVHRPLWALGLGLVLGLPLLAPWASADPDGLERVARTLGFHTAARPPLYTLLPDYTIPFLPNQLLSTVAAGGVGVLVVFSVVRGIAKLRRRTSA